MKKITGCRKADRKHFVLDTIYRIWKNSVRTEYDFALGICKARPPATVKTVDEVFPPTFIETAAGKTSNFLSLVFYFPRISFPGRNFSLSYLKCRRTRRFFHRSRRDLRGIKSLTYQIYFSLYAYLCLACKKFIAKCESIIIPAVIPRYSATQTKIFGAESFHAFCQKR